MAAIVLGLGTSHTPMLSTSVDFWSARLDGDRALFEDRWDDLVSARSASLADQLRPEVWAERHARVQAAIDELHRALVEAEVDVLVIVGDDQEEVFPPGTLPPISVWCAGSAVDQPPDPLTLPAFRVASLWAFHSPDGPTVYPCRDDLAARLADQLGSAGFDVATVWSPPPGRHLGHAFTFVQRRLVQGDPVPMVPLLLNTFYPRSQPSVRRCLDLGSQLADAIAAWPGRERVAVVASGGLSHHLVDDELDRRLLMALAAADGDELLRAWPDSSFGDGDRPCGTGESKNWIVAGSAARAAGLTMDVVAYEPLYRTPAGTGVGAAFCRWLSPGGS